MDTYNIPKINKYRCWVFVFAFSCCIIILTKHPFPPSVRPSFLSHSTMNFLASLKTHAMAAHEKVSKAVAEIDTTQVSQFTSQFNLDNLQKRMDDALTNGIPDGSEQDHRVRGLDFTYVTPRLIAMGFPRSAGQVNERPRANPIEEVANLLNKRHKDRYMIWNLSEEEYDYEAFNNQVQEYRFPGHPAPPLGLLFQICTSLESWLSQDPANVAVVHCLTGKGRTASVIACVLSWIGEFESPVDALQHVALKRRCREERLVIPSQRRYVQYFTSVMDGVKPRAEPVVLKRVIVNTIPTFFKNSAVKDTLREHENSCDGCRPYLQVFKNGKLLFSSTWRGGQGTDDLQAYYTSDGVFSFNVDCVLDGDVLVRCRHVDIDGKRSSMFRAAFHTGYIPQGIQRLQKSQCDGANFDKRFAVEFFVDLIFEPVLSSSKRRANSSSMSMEHYDEMMASTSKFWSEISKRKEKIRQAKLKGWRSIIDKRPRPAAAAGNGRGAAAGSRRKGSDKTNNNSAKTGKAGGARKKRNDAFSIDGDGEDEEDAPGRAAAVQAAGAAAGKKRQQELAKKREQDAAAKQKARAAARKKAGEDAAAKKKAEEATRLTDESNQQLDELADLEKELGLESLSDEIRNFDNLPKELGDSSAGDAAVAAASKSLEGTAAQGGASSSGSATPNHQEDVGSLEDELNDLDAELAALGGDDGIDGLDLSGDGDLDDAMFAELEAEFDSLG